MVLRFQSAEVEESWFVAIFWSVLPFFFLFFCNHAFIVFRYKRPHPALAMEKTKPINQKTITKESHGTSKYPQSCRFRLRRALGHIKNKGTNCQFSRRKRKAYQSNMKEKPNRRKHQPMKNHERPGGAAWGERGLAEGKTDGLKVGTSSEAIRWR